MYLRVFCDVNIFNYYYYYYYFKFKFLNYHLEENLEREISRFRTNFICNLLIFIK